MMNVVGLLAGNLVGGAAEGIADKFIKNLMPPNAPKFLDALKQHRGDDKLGINDLDLSREEELSLMEMRNSAQQKGMASLEVEINGKRYLMDTKDVSFVPMV